MKQDLLRHMEPRWRGSQVHVGLRPHTRKALECVSCLWPPAGSRANLLVTMRLTMAQLDAALQMGLGVPVGSKLPTLDRAQLLEAGANDWTVLAPCLWQGVSQLCTACRPRRLCAKNTPVEAAGCKAWIWRPWSLFLPLRLYLPTLRLHPLRLRLAALRGGRERDAHRDGGCGASAALPAPALTQSLATWLPCSSCLTGGLA